MDLKHKFWSGVRPARAHPVTEGRSQKVHRTELPRRSASQIQALLVVQLEVEVGAGLGTPFPEAAAMTESTLPFSGNDLLAGAVKLSEAGPERQSVRLSLGKSTVNQRTMGQAGPHRAPRDRGQNVVQPDGRICISKEIMLRRTGSGLMGSLENRLDGDRASFTGAQPTELWLLRQEWLYLGERPTELQNVEAIPQIPCAPNFHLALPVGEPTRADGLMQTL